ncbi:hypothetical protein EB796_001013 [Bugula neritina]|uniref:Uncharacterized protein n=1 Tax=Bugula neritina TaxID=10212 RepID=A0A7J7KR77_BUGNE|nr:hypothetical protein EB796_001013 [Bugula neritina]
MSQLKRQVSSLTEALSKMTTNKAKGGSSSSADCQTEGCDRPIDWYCRYCKGFICTRCSKKPCGDEAQHQSEDFEEMYELCTNKYKEYLDGKNSAVSGLTQQQKKLQEELASDIKRMSDVTPEQLASPEIIKITADLPRKQKLLQDISKQLKEAEAFQSVDIKSMSQQEFITVFDKLDFDGYVFAVTDLDRITLGEKCEVISDKKCYDLDVIPSGQILIGKKDGFDICDKNGKVLRSVKVNGFSITTVQYYKSKIYTLAKDYTKDSKKRKVMVFEMPNYTESASWSLPDFGYISMLAVNNDKVYVVDCDAKKVKVYSLTGKQISDFSHSGFIDPIYMSSCPPDGVLVTDWQTGLVYKINCMNDQLAWEFKVNEPRGVFCDKLGNIWVWARKSKELVLRSSDGKQTKSFSHPELLKTGVDFITGFSMSEGELWLAAYSKGVMRIEMNVAPAK